MKNSIYYATGNPGKVKSLAREMERYNINVIQIGLDIPEPRSDDVQEIADKKVIYAYSKIRCPVVALDAGFYIDSLNGFPRAFVNFALDTIGLEGILKLTEGKDRRCEFRECLAYLDNNMTPKYFTGHVRGMLATEERGIVKKEQWSKLWMVFIPDGTDKTLAEMTQEEYNAWREISRAETSPSRQFAEWYVKQK